MQYGPCVEILRENFAGPFPFRSAQLRHYGGDHCIGNLVLDIKYVLKVSVIFFSPNVATCFTVD